MSDKAIHIENTFVHYDPAHIQVRRDFMRICDYKKYGIKCEPKEKPSLECMAKLLRYFEYERDGQLRGWITKKLNSKERNVEKPDSWPIAASMETLIALATMHTDSDATVRRALAMLVEMKYITRTIEYGKTTVFYLEEKIIQARLNEEHSAFSTSPNLSKLQPPQIYRGEELGKSPPQISGGDSCSSLPKFTPTYNNKEDYNNNDQSSSKNLPETGNEEPQLKPWQKMEAAFTPEQKRMHDLNVKSDPDVRILKKRFQNEQVDLYVAALDKFAALGDLITLESLKKMRTFLPSKASGIKYFQDGNTIHLWNLSENYGKYVAWEGAKVVNHENNYTFNPPVEPVRVRTTKKFELRMPTPEERAALKAQQKAN